MLNKAKPKRLKCKGYDLGDDIVANSTVGTKSLLSSKLPLDTRVARFGRALGKGIPVLSIFALLGIMVGSVSCNALSTPKDSSTFFNLANIINPISLLSNVGDIVAGGDNEAYAETYTATSG